MTYTVFDKGKPDEGTQGIAAYSGSVRANLVALRDQIAAGSLLDWAGTPAGSDLSQPDSLTLASGTERVRLTFTWNSGNVTKIKYEYSANSGSTWDNMGTNCFQTISYDVDGNVSGWTWGAS